MRTTVTLDDELVAAAQEFGAPAEKSALVNLALKRFVETEAARRLRLLKGAIPDFPSAPPRQRLDPDPEWS